MSWFKGFKLRRVMKAMKLAGKFTKPLFHRIIRQTPVVTFGICVALAFLFVAPARGALQLPVPPQQYAAWQAPLTKLPTEVVTATRELFLLGLADPRGCEYQEITITTGDVWGRIHQTKTHGWVLPQNNASDDFAIAWNGLIYPLTAHGERRNLRDDVANLSPFEIRQALPEPQAVGLPPRSLLGVCLLLRLGESESAEKLWNAARRAPLARTNIKRAPPLEELASHWAWALWDRALCAHGRGADELALHDATQLKQLQGLLASPTPKANPQKANPQKANSPKASSQKTRGSKTQYKAPFRLAFLQPLPRLLADQERRARAVKMVSDDEIDVLIHNLENVSARQWGQPGGVDLTTAPVVQEIIAHGEAALPALLNVIEADQRLTRSIAFHRDYFTNRNLISTAEAAYAALQKISGQSFGPASDIASNGAKRADLVKRARAKLLPSTLVVATKSATKPTPKPTKASTPKPSKSFAASPDFKAIAARLRAAAKSDSPVKTSNLDALFAPLWLYRAQPALKTLSQELFSDKASAWNPLIDPRRSGHWNDIVAGPLLSVAAYRAQVARQLKNWSRCGTLEVLPENKISIRTNEKNTGETPIISVAQPLSLPPIGTKIEFRICDFYGWQLSQIEGAPRCELYWPFDKRDRAVAEVAAWLQAYGALLQPAWQPAPHDAANQPARLVFPSLKRPATRAEAQAHRAIFSLQGLGKTRLVNLKLPTRARWKNQEVTIWQAEEIAVGNQWRRYYGIVATHEIRRVTAGEVEPLKTK